MVKHIPLCAFFTLLAALAQSDDMFSAEALQSASSASEEANRDFKSRLELMSDESLELLDTSTVTYDIDGRTFAGIVLPNGLLAPAIVNRATGQRREACIDRFYQLHPAQYNTLTGKVDCEIRKADLLASVAEMQSSAGDQKVKKPKIAVNTSQNNDTSPEVTEPDSPVVEEVKPATAPPKVEVKVQPKVTVQAEPPKKTQVVQASKSSIPDDWYLPPLSEPGQAQSSVYSIDATQENAFGIRKGTWVKAEIQRTVRSSDRSEVEVVLLESIHGKNQTIPAGTVLFSSPSFNVGSRRLDLTITNFIFDDKTIPMSGSIYDRNKEYGLPGRIIRDRESEFAAASGQALKSTVAGAAALLPFAGDPVADGAGVFTDEMIDNEFAYLPEGQAAVVQVSPQVVYLQIMNNL